MVGNILILWPHLNLAVVALLAPDRCLFKMNCVYGHNESEEYSLTSLKLEGSMGDSS